MRKEKFPLNSETKNPSLFFSDKPYKKWEIKVKEGYEDRVKNAKKISDSVLGYEPKWNEYNYGLITICDKKEIFNEGKGVFINIGGCNWQGTEGCSWYILNEDKLKELIEYINFHKRNYR